MGATLITGATGSIGARTVRRLVERGDEVRVLLRPSSSGDGLEGLAVTRMAGDILDRGSVRHALRGVDRVFHCAGLTSLRARPEQLMRVNVDGTRTVLEECLRAEVQRVVYTSSVAAVGPAPRGSTADEEQPFPPGASGIPYVDARHEAEVQALRVAARGLPVVIVCPAYVLGGGTRRSAVGLVRRFLQRRIPAYVDGAVCIVDVEDVARGLVLADERGRPGERYILGNRNYTLDRLFADLARLSEVAPPALKLPLPAALAFAAAAEALPGRPAITQVEVRATGQWWTFRNGKARRELGWTPGPHEETVERSVAWFREHDLEGLAPPGSGQPLPLRLLGHASRQLSGLGGQFAR